MEIENDIDEDENDGHRLNIDESREQNTTIDEHDEQSSDDEQVGRFTLDQMSLVIERNWFHFSLSISSFSMIQ